MSELKWMEIPAKETPVIEADVCVVGAGTAGCIAALAAARKGAKVVLIEKMPVPTGTLANGGDVQFSFHNAEVDPAKAKRIVGGLPYELIERINAAGGGTGFMPQENSPQPCPFLVFSNYEVVKGVLCEMLLESGVKVYLQTMLCGVLREGSRITAALIENKDGRAAIVAKQFIDASGDGDVARFAGVQQGENWDHYDEVCGGPTSLPFAMGGIDFDRAAKENPKGFIKRYGKEQCHAEGRTDGVDGYIFTYKMDPDRYKPFLDLDIRFFTSFTSLHPNRADFINNSKGVKTDASKAENLSQAELEMRVKIMRLAKAFKDCVPGFENAYMSWAAIQLGIRSSKITYCDKMLTQDEISAGARFEDEIGLYGYHDLSASREHCKIGGDGFYGLPYRMLLAKDCDNLFMAGRCVTLDIEAHMSTRNTIGCMLMGEGAGTAAALCAANDCTTRQLSYATLRSTLLEQGVILDA